MRAVVFIRLSPLPAGSIQSLGPLTLDSLVQRLNALPLLCRFLLQREMLLPRHGADQRKQHEEAADPPSSFRNPSQPALQLDEFAAPTRRMAMMTMSRKTTIYGHTIRSIRLWT